MNLESIQNYTKEQKPKIAPFTLALGFLLSGCDNLTAPKPVESPKLPELNIKSPLEKRLDLVNDGIGFKPGYFQLPGGNACSMSYFKPQDESIKQVYVLTARHCFLNNLEILENLPEDSGDISEIVDEITKNEKGEYVSDSALVLNMEVLRANRAEVGNFQVDVSSVKMKSNKFVPCPFIEKGKYTVIGLIKTVSDTNSLSKAVVKGNSGSGIFKKQKDGNVCFDGVLIGGFELDGKIINTIMVSPDTDRTKQWRFNSLTDSKPIRK